MTLVIYAAKQGKDAAKPVSYKCSWCSKWFSKDDAWRAFCGAKTSHGLCKDCASYLEADEEAEK